MAVSEARRRLGFREAGAPPNLTLAPRPDRLSPARAGLPNGLHLTFTQPYEVVAEGPDGYAAFSDPFGYLAVFVPAFDGGGYLLDCAVSGPPTLRVSISRLAPLEPIIESNFTVQNGHIFIYVTPDGAGRRRLVTISTGGLDGLAS